MFYVLTAIGEGLTIGMREALENIYQRPFSDSGDNLKARCPYHDDGTPSFFVHKEEFTANCFGCGKGGYIDTLVAAQLAITPRQARERLGINRILTNMNRKVKDDKPSYFPESWLAPYEKKIHKSLLRRGYETEVLRSCAVRYDSALGRQIFPHRDRSGGLVGVFGRACRNQQPKWLFYWNYPRGATLYRPWDGQPDSGHVILCEGALDIIRLKQAGWDCDLAATKGTKVTRRHIRELREYDRVTLAYDNDDSGRETTEKLYAALRQDCIVNFAIFPGNDIGDLTDDEASNIKIVSNVSRKILSTSN